MKRLRRLGMTLLHSQYLSVAARWASDLEESEAIQHCNVYFTHHFIPMDLKPSPTNTTGVMINIFDIHNIQQTGWTDRGWGGRKRELYLWTIVTAVITAVTRNRHVIEFL